MFYVGLGLWLLCSLVFVAGYMLGRGMLAQEQRETRWERLQRMER